MSSNSRNVQHRGHILAKGRVNQKMRTRQSLADAAVKLAKSGRRPTLPEIAAEAKVSRATAYRYFSSSDAMISDSYFDHAAQRARTLFIAEGGDPVDRIGRAADTINRLLIEDEIGVHVMLKSLMDVWLSNPPADRPPRPGRRMPLIDDVLARLDVKLDAGRRVRLRRALALTMGTEAVITLCDVCGASPEEMIEVSTWAARTLLRAALDEAQSAARIRRRTKK